MIYSLKVVYSNLCKQNKLGGYYKLYNLLRRLYFGCTLSPSPDLHIREPDSLEDCQVEGCQFRNRSLAAVPGCVLNYQPEQRRNNVRQIIWKTDVTKFWKEKYKIHCYPHPQIWKSNYSSYLKIHFLTWIWYMRSVKELWSKIFGVFFFFHTQIKQAKAAAWW